MRTEKRRRGVYVAPSKEFNLKESYFGYIQLIADKSQELQESAFLAWKAMDEAEKRGATHISFKNVELNREKHLYLLRKICSNMDDLLETLDEEIELAGRK
jgi:hypothetical protein